MRMLENISMMALLGLLSIIGIGLLILISPIVYVITGFIGTVEFYRGVIGGIKKWGKKE